MSVFVSGATGFIAKHIVSQLLEQNYAVIGSVRSAAKAEKLLSQFGNNPKLTLEIVPDISKLDAFDEVFKKHAEGIKYVIHSASPFFFNTSDYEKDLLTPAVNGTKGILSSIKTYAKKVERVVVTSSCAAIITLSKMGDSSVVYTEESWNEASWEECQANGVSAYCGSKKFAELAAWEFVKNNDVNFKLTTVNPTHVFGPQAFDEDVTDHLNTSCEVINGIIHTKPDSPIRDFHSDFIDVRDVAKAHLAAFEKSNTVGKRLVLDNGKVGTQDVLDILNSDFPSLKGKIPVGQPGQGDQVTNPGATTDNRKTKDILGFPFRSLHEVVHDTAAQILKKDGLI